MKKKMLLKQVALKKMLLTFSDKCCLQWHMWQVKKNSLKTNEDAFEMNYWLVQAVRRNFVLHESTLRYAEI